MAESSAMIYMQAGLGRGTITGNGSARSRGLPGALLGPGRRLLTRESLLTNDF